MAPSSSSSEDTSGSSSDSSSDEERQQCKKAKRAQKQQQLKQPQPKSLLPSALDVLDSVGGPSFLTTYSDGFEVPVVEGKRSPSPDPHEQWQKRQKRSSDDASAAAPAVPAATANSSAAAAAIAAATAMANTYMPPPKPGTKGPAPPETKGAPKKDTAKDKVKNQRLRGQSGIGSDFRTWKTDEEMRQRQQYD